MAMLTRMENLAPTMLTKAYTKAIEIGRQFGQQGMEPQGVRHPNNLVPPLAYQAPANQLVIHLGPPLSQAPPLVPFYLQGASSSTRMQEENDEMMELIV